MKVLGFTLVACLLSLSAPAADTTKTDKLIGTWESVKGDLPKGSTIEFTKDGKLKLTVTVEGKTVTVNGTYKVDGDSLKATSTQAGKEMTEAHTIKELTDTKLVTVDEKGKIDEFKRKK